MQQEQLNNPFISTNAALVVIDIQGELQAEEEYDAIPIMSGWDTRLRKSGQAIAAARAHNIPVIFIQEVHRDNLVDFGRELDGEEKVHCLEGDPSTAICAPELDFRADDYLIKKRRYSAFFGTDFEILLKGLKVDTLILCGCLTDVCVHYTFVDAHQSDYFCRVLEDCTAGSSLVAHNSALQAMEYLQSNSIWNLEYFNEQLQSSLLGEEKESA